MGEEMEVQKMRQLVPNHRHYRASSSRQYQSNFKGCAYLPVNSSIPCHMELFLHSSLGLLGWN